MDPGILFLWQKLAQNTRKCQSAPILGGYNGTHIPETDTTPPKKFVDAPLKLKQLFSSRLSILHKLSVFYPCFGAQ